jgi:hypothetical protein
VIRAINPVEGMLLVRDVDSIVDSFFNVAIQIAKENNLVAVAFPCDGGQHFLSNTLMVENLITERFIKKSSQMNQFDFNDEAKPRINQPRRISLPFL